MSGLALALISPLRASAQCGTTGPTGSVSWTTQLCDEFNGAANSTIDRTKWAFDTGNSGCGNNELQTYCDPSSNTAPCSSSSPNAFIDGKGHLAIQVRSPAANTWTSARLKSQGLQEFHAGRIEASIQFPSATGLWPAFWLLASSSMRSSMGLPSTPPFSLISAAATLYPATSMAPKVAKLPEREVITPRRIGSAGDAGREAQRSRAAMAKSRRRMGAQASTPRCEGSKSFSPE